MKIALPSRQNQVDEHFGHCEYFTVYTVNESMKSCRRKRFPLQPIAGANRTLPRRWHRWASR